MPSMALSYRRARYPGWHYQFTSIEACTSWGLLSEFVLVTLGIDDDAELPADQIVGVIGEDRAYFAKS